MDRKMPKETTYADVDDAMHNLVKALEPRGKDYTVGWLKGMVGSMVLNSDIKLSKRQVKAMEAYILKNIEWARKD